MNKFYVYEHWRLDRDECFYVGKGTGKRAYEMFGRNRHHKAITAKLNRTGSAMEVRIVQSGLTEADSFALEIERISFWISAGVDLANLTNGGEGTSGYKITEEARAKRSAVFKGRKQTPEWIAKRAEANRGKKASAEARKNLSDAAQRRWATEDREAWGKKMVGWQASRGEIKFTEEHKKKLSEGQKSAHAAMRAAGIKRVVSEEQKEKLRIRTLGVPRSDEVKAKISAANKGRKLGPPSAEILAKRAATRLRNKAIKIEEELKQKVEVK